MNDSRPSQFVLGLALFSMFFGSGNLIFPLFLGQLAQGSWLIALAGFLVTAVCLPLLGVIAMVMYEGHYRKFFDLLGSPWGFILTLVLLLVWIPLGSAPRCISLSFASLGTYLSMGSPWVYGALYSLATCLVVLCRGGMIRILGSFLTPMLLLCLAAIFFAGLGAHPVESTIEPLGLAFTSIKEGYNTMDLIASFFFSASVIGILQKQGGSLASNLKLTLRAGVVAATVLGLVYASLLYTAATHSQDLISVSKEQMLAHLSKVTLGSNLGIVAALAIFLACFTTSVALVAVFTEFLTDSIFCNKSFYGLSLFITLVASYLMSITGLEGITAVTSPALQVSYPLLLLVIVGGVFKKAREHFYTKKLSEDSSVEPTLSPD